MPVMYVIPWLDILLGVIFLGLVALGFWQGMLKEIWFLIAVYLASVLASLTGDRLGGLFQSGLGVAAPEVASTWGFLAVFVLTTVILYSVIYSLVGQLRLRESFLPLDKIGGVAIGLITSFVVTTFIAFAMNALVPLGPEEWAITAALKVQRETAAPVLRLFLRARPVILATIQIWLPREFEIPYFLQIGQV